MSNQVLCDACGEPIDTTKSHYSVTGQAQHVDETGVMITDEASQQLDFHKEHLPWDPATQSPVQKPVDPAPEEPEQPVDGGDVEPAPVTPEQATT